MPNLSALRVDIDGTASHLDLPVAFDERTAALREQFTGGVDHARFTLCSSASMCLAIHAHSPHPLPPNDFATLLLSVLGHDLLPHDLYGPVIFLGPVDRNGHPTGLPADMAQALLATLSSMRAVLYPEPV